jgi:hypothetical protein
MLQTRQAFAAVLWQEVVVVQQRLQARGECVWCADGPGWWAHAYFTHTSASCFQRSRANRTRVKGRRFVQGPGARVRVSLRYERSTHLG